MGGGVGQRRRRVGKDLATAELEGDWAFFSFFLLFFFGNALDRAQKFETRIFLVS